MVGTVGFNMKFKSELVMTRSELARALKAASAELEEEAVEWVQYKMLYGYHDPHGEDRHTEIYDTYRESGIHMIDDIHANTQRNSQDSYSVMVGTNKEYAVFVHNGTTKLKGRPFLRDALNDHIDDIERIIRKYLEK